MKRLLFFTIVFLTTFNLHSQDLIITKEGDTINCEVVSIDNLFIHFKRNIDGKEITSAMPQTMISEIKIFKDVEVQTSMDSFNKSELLTRLSVSGGWGYRIAKLSPNIPKGFEKYYKDLMQGNNLAFELNWYFKKDYGLGFKYNIFYVSNYLDNVTVIYLNGTTQTGKMEDKITLYFVGAVLSTRHIFKNKNIIYIFNFSGGYLKYIDQAEIVGTFFNIEARSIGLNIDTGLEFLISKKTWFGINTGLLSGSFNQFRVNGTLYKLKSEDIENVSRVDIALGLRFYF